MENWRSLGGGLTVVSSLSVAVALIVKRSDGLQHFGSSARSLRGEMPSRALWATRIVFAALFNDNDAWHGHALASMNALAHSRKISLRFDFIYVSCDNFSWAGASSSMTTSVFGMSKKEWAMNRSHHGAHKGIFFSSISNLLASVDLRATILSSFHVSARISSVPVSSTTFAATSPPAVEDVKKTRFVRKSFGWRCVFSAKSKSLVLHFFFTRAILILEYTNVTWQTRPAAAPITGGIYIL